MTEGNFVALTFYSTLSSFLKYDPGIVTSFHDFHKKRRRRTYLYLLWVCLSSTSYESAKRPYAEGTVPNCPARTFYSGYESMCGK